MKKTFLIIILLFLSVQIYSQSYLKLIIQNDTTYIPAFEKNDILYFSIKRFASVLNINFSTSNKPESLDLKFSEYDLRFNAQNPFVNIFYKSKNENQIYQLPTSTYFLNNQIYIPVNYCIEPLSIALDRKLYFIDPNIILVGNDRPDSSLVFNEKVFHSPKEDCRFDIPSISVEERESGTLIKIRSNKRIPSFNSYYKDGIFTLSLNGVKVDENSINKFRGNGIVRDIDAKNFNYSAELNFNVGNKYAASEVFRLGGSDDLLIKIYPKDERDGWYEQESEHFKVVYRESHSPLVPHILSSAEAALKVLMKLFHYTPSEKIVINTYDVSDYGFGATTTVPENYIRLEIEPLEPGYENIPFNDRLKWIISHELVHVVVNDHASGIESVTRSIFGKVSPEQVEPMTIPFSLLTNFGRYTPRWHQESIAVFMETWLSGGFGRILGNFDEMYFRSMVFENKTFPTELSLDATLSHNNFLLETLFYLYGARFASYVAAKYGADKLLDWFTAQPGDFYGGFKNKFKAVYGVDFSDAWKSFIKNEKEFQRQNIARIESAPITPIKRLTDEPTGWVTKEYLDYTGKSLIFGYHRPNHLAGIKELNLLTSQYTQIASLPTPSMYQVASTAYDPASNLFFYTTKNNQLYRDICVLDPATKDEKILFKNARVGELTISPEMHELWGIQNSGGIASLVYSPYPYHSLTQIASFDMGDEVESMSVSPSGKFLAIVIHRVNGDQMLVIANRNELLNGKSFKYKTITDSGSPDNPSWSPDEKFLLWNAYTNGVSNIYRYDFATSQITPLSNTVLGLFKPIYISPASIFAFEFSAEGFYPVIIPNEPASELPAIKYMGERILDKSSKVLSWAVQTGEDTEAALKIRKEEQYSGLANLKLQTFIPVITGFQKQKVLGFFVHVGDPLFEQELTMEFGISPFNDMPSGPKYHFKGKYEYKKQYLLEYSYNGTDFYDLFNNRKRGMIGTKLTAQNSHYWIYDNPLKIMQKTQLDLYTGVEFINDNLVHVSQPDFLVGQTSFNVKDLRKTIGSSDYEYGNDFTGTIIGFGTDPKNPQYAGQIYGEWDHFTTWAFAHNVFHLKVASGYAVKNDELFQALFFFGGFGNRAVENVDVKQYRKIFRFPGIPIYSLDADKFGKVMLENDFPPIRFGWAGIGEHYLSHIDFDLYSQGLLVSSSQNDKWVDLGAQINIVFKHWYNLESTFSAGIANAWWKGGTSWEWFLSFKLLKN